MQIAAPPRISPERFHRVLLAGGSPAAGENTDQGLYRICVDRGVDPAIALAFFRHESSFGTQGKAVTTLNWGNLRAGRRAYLIAPVGGAGGNFAWYRSWAEGLQDFCDLLRGRLYEGAGLTTVAQVVPKYAPASDNNVPARYIAAVEADVRRWSDAVDPWASWGSDWPPVAEWAIPRRWLVEGGLGRALGPEQSLGPQRAAQAFERGVIVWFGGERTEVVR